MIIILTLLSWWCSMLLLPNWHIYPLIIFIHFGLSLVVSELGKDKKIGEYNTFIICMWCTPLIGLLVVAASAQIKNKASL